MKTNKTVTGPEGFDWYSFAFFSANIYHVMEMTDLQQQMRLYHRTVSYTDIQADTEGIPLVGAESGNMEWDKPGMMVSFHYGLYRQQPLQMLVAGKKVCVLVSRTVRKAQEEIYRQVIGPARKNNLRFAEAEDPSLFFKLRQCLSEGYHILCYADGNRDAAVSPRNPKTAKVPLLSTHMRVRTGFLHMAYLLGCPVYPIWDGTTIEGDGEGQQEIDPQAYRSKEVFIQKSIEYIYGSFDVSVREEPYKWEGWFYLHESIVGCIENKKKLTQAEERYIPFERADKYYLLDKATYACYPISQMKYREIQKWFWQRMRN